MSTLLQITEDLYNQPIISEVGFLPTLEFGLEMLLLGMGTVFAVLALLWGCLTVFKIVFYDLKNNKTATETPNEAVTSMVETDTPQNDDEEIIAVIAAAIAAAENEAPGLKFRVVAFNRK